MKAVLAFLLLIVLIALAAPVLAQTGTTQTDVPPFSMKRLAISGGAGYAWHDGDLDNLPRFRKEWEVGMFGAYVLPTASGRLNLVGSTVYGVDNRTFRSTVGLRLGLWQGNRP